LKTADEVLELSGYRNLTDTNQLPMSFVPNWNRAIQ